MLGDKANEEKMNAFYKSVEDIIVFSGNLNELNKQEKAMKTGKSFELLPMQGNLRFVRGLLIPSFDEIKENTKLMISLAKGDDIKDNDFDLEKNLNMIYTNYYTKKQVSDLDIRLKAKELGANGIIHRQFDNNPALYLRNNDLLKSMIFAFYTGVPVRYKTK